MRSRFKLWSAMVRVHSAAFSSSSSSQPQLLLQQKKKLGPAGAETTAKPPADQREVFTIWMKSLVLHGSGCTVYDSTGTIVYRVDNYGARSAADVCLMDLAGNVVLQILKKKLGFGRRWDGYRCEQQERRRRRPWFKVVRAWAWRGPSSCTCELVSSSRGDDASNAVHYYKMDDGRIEPARAARIVDGVTGLAVAEVRRKTTPAGVALGADVLTLAVEPGADRAIVMALVLVHGLINRTM